MNTDILKPEVGNDLQYVVAILCLLQLLTMFGPKILEAWNGRKKVVSNDDGGGVATDPKIITMEQQVDRLSNDVGDIKGCMVDLKAMQIELLAQFRQMRDDNKDALVRVHDRIDTHLDGHPQRIGK